jgi:hypothetical protein
MGPPNKMHSKESHLMKIICNVAIASEYLKNVYTVTKCVDSDPGVEIEIKIIIFYFTLSPTSKITRTAVD